FVCLAGKRLSGNGRLLFVSPRFSGGAGKYRGCWGTVNVIIRLFGQSAGLFPLFCQNRGWIWEKLHDSFIIFVYTKLVDFLPVFFTKSAEWNKIPGFPHGVV